MALAHFATAHHCIPAGPAAELLDLFFQKITTHCLSALTRGKVLI